MAQSDQANAAGSGQAWNPRLALLVAATFFMEFLDGTVRTNDPDLLTAFVQVINL